MAIVLACFVAILSVAVLVLVVQLRARDADAPRRRAFLLRVLTTQEARLVAEVGAAMNDAGMPSTWPGEMCTTREQRGTIAERHGLSASVEETAHALGLELVVSLECSRRNPAMIVGDELLCRPDDTRAALVVCAAEAFERERREYTWEDAQALADEILSGASSSSATR